MKPQIEPELHKRAPLPLFACVPCWHNVLAVTCSVPLEENFSTILLLTTIASFFQHTLVTCLLFTRTNSAFFIYCVPPPLVFPSTRKHEPRCCEGSGFDDRFRVSIFWRCSYKLPITLLEPFSLFVWFFLACGGSLRFFFILFSFTRRVIRHLYFIFPSVFMTRSRLNADTFVPTEHHWQLRMWTFHETCFFYFGEQDISPSLLFFCIVYAIHLDFLLFA